MYIFSNFVKNSRPVGLEPTASGFGNLRSTNWTKSVFFRFQKKFLGQFFYSNSHFYFFTFWLRRRAFKTSSKLRSESVNKFTNIKLNTKNFSKKFFEKISKNKKMIFFEIEKKNEFIKIMTFFKKNVNSQVKKKNLTKINMISKNYCEKITNFFWKEAGNATRTRDILLGKEVFYRLNYTRTYWIYIYIYVTLKYERIQLSNVETIFSISKIFLPAAKIFSLKLQKYINSLTTSNIIFTNLLCRYESRRPNIREWNHFLNNSYVFTYFFDSKNFI